MARTDDIMDVDPETISDDAAYDLVRDALTAEENLIRDRATSVCLDLAEDIDRVMPVVPSLIERLDDDNIVVLLNTTTTLALVAEQRPEKLNAAVEPLIERLGDDHSRIRVFAAQALQSISNASPEWFIPHVDALVSLLAERAASIESRADPIDTRMMEHVGHIRVEEKERRAIARSVVGDLLVTAANADPIVVKPHVSTLIDLLSYDNTDTVVVIAAVDALGTLAESDPESASEAADSLSACLDHDSERVQALSVMALGFINDPETVSSLRALAIDEERDDTLRELATDTADWIASASDSSSDPASDPDSENEDLG